MQCLPGDLRNPVSNQRRQAIIFRLGGVVLEGSRRVRRCVRFLDRNQDGQPDNRDRHTDQHQVHREPLGYSLIRFLGHGGPPTIPLCAGGAQGSYDLAHMRHMSHAIARKASDTTGDHRAKDNFRRDPARRLADADGCSCRTSSPLNEGGPGAAQWQQPGGCAFPGGTEHRVLAGSRALVWWAVSSALLRQ